MTYVVQNKNMPKFTKCIILITKTPSFMVSFHIMMRFYYTPVLEQTTNTEPGVQYSCESRPPLTRRERLHRYPVHSPELEVEKTGSPPSAGF